MLLAMRVPAVVVSLLFGGSCAHDATAPHRPPPSTACPAAWLTQSPVDPSLAAPDPSLRVVARASATGTQSYRCALSSADGGAAYGWTFLGPEATLADCKGSPFGRHFASEGGAAAPEWQAQDGSFVVAKKIASVASTESGAVPWLLLQVTASSGSGTLGTVAFVQRTGTKGGAMPTGGCDAAHAGAQVSVRYAADYWFLAK